MAEIKLFNLTPSVTEVHGTSVNLERELQNIIEKNMHTFFGVQFLKSEHSITNGRIDSLGIDENNCPVILEYKRSMNENVINQGLFYLDWLLDHKADFKFLVMEKLGIEKAEAIDWSIPCVMCIASDFTKFDEHAVNQMQRNIKLIRYKKYGNDQLLFEHLNAPIVKPIVDPSESISLTRTDYTKTFTQQIESATLEMKTIYENIRDYILSLGDDITENQLKRYVAFKKVNNVVCAEIQTSKILLHLRLNPESVNLCDDFIKDVRNVGHWGTGDLQIIIKSMNDFEKAKELINRAYYEN